MTIRKILIINIFGIGDVLFTTPLIKNIKSNNPKAFIGYVANARTAPILAKSLDIDKVYTYERDEYQAVYKKSKLTFLNKIRTALKEIKKVKYDLVIDLSMNASASFLMMLVGIPQRLGYNYRNRSRYLTKKIPIEGYDDQHVTEYYLNLLNELEYERHTSALSIPLEEDDHNWVKDFLERQISLREPLIALVPGGGASWGKDAVYKRWSAQKYAHLADKIIENFGATIILLGDKSERGLCQRIEEHMKAEAILACGQTNITQCAALMQECSLVVCNDGGPLHIAVAAGAKTVSIFGPVDERVYGPYPPEGHTVITSSIACRPCYRQFRRAQCDHINCLNNISVEDVLKGVRDSLELSINH